MDKDNPFTHGYPVKSYSWTFVSDRIAIKKTDKSCFLHHGTGIPINTTEFFNVHNLSPKEKKIL